jgi:hypothetical protein
MNVRIPVPRPPDSLETPARGGVDEEELRRIQQRAERFVAEQTAIAGVAMNRQEDQEQALRLRQAEIAEARAVIARAQTLKAEGNSRMAMGVAGGAFLGLLLGSLLLGGRRR